MSRGGGRVFEPDPATVAAAAAGSTAAFEELVQAYRVPIWRFLTHLTSDRVLAEDLTQETFLRVYTHLDRFEGRSKFSTWVFQIARNVGIDSLRRRERRNLLPIRLGRTPTTAPSHEGDVTILAVVAGLATDLRESILLVEILGLTYREVAAVVGIPEGTAKSRVFRARKELARQLADGEVADEM